MRNVEKAPRDSCFYCDKSIAKSEDGFFIPLSKIRRRGVLITQAVQVCSTCHGIEVALLEAAGARRRFTEVDCKNRCACGAVAHTKLGWCVRCWKDYRMLEKQEADARFNRRLINQLKEEMKNGKDQDNRRAA